MKIREVRLRLAELANTTLKTSYGANVTTRSHLFVSLRADDGSEGIGEGSPLPHFSGERAREMRSVVRELLAPALIGADVFNTEAIVATLERTLPHHQASKAALVSALLDLQGKLLGQPVHVLLGGHHVDAVPVAGAVGIEPPERVGDRIAELLEQGITTFKLKVGHDVERDVRVVRHVRERFGNDIEVRADANGGFSRAAAVRFLEGVRDCRLQYLEQPLPPKRLHDLAELRARSPFPIGVDESLYGLADAFEIARLGAADVFVIKLIKLGGLHGARKVVAIAEAAGIRCTVVSPYETAVGVAADVHLAASSAAFAFAAELGVGVSEVELPGVTGLAYARGAALLPEAPGLGIELPAGFFSESRENVEVIGA